MAQIQICRGFGDKDWEKLSKRLKLKEGARPEDWNRAIDIFERRMVERFFLCIGELEHITPSIYEELSDDVPDADRLLPEVSTTTGFAITAICCLLIDTLQFFRAGEQPRLTPTNCPSLNDRKCAGTYPGTTRAFKVFLEKHLEFSKDEAKYFVNGIRHKLIHQAETNGWVIRRDKPEGSIVACGERPYVLNRTQLCDALTNYFQRYIRELREGRDVELRQHFLSGMQHVAETCRKIKQ